MDWTSPVEGVLRDFLKKSGQRHTWSILIESGMYFDGDTNFPAVVLGGLIKAKEGLYFGLAICKGGFWLYDKREGLLEPGGPA